MRRALLSLVLAAAFVLGFTAPVDAAPPAASGTIVLDQAGPFTVVVNGLKGSQWPMVYLVCYSTLDGDLLVGQLDHPDATFLIGGAWSPWRNPDNVGEDGNCVGRLYTYSKQGDITLLAETEVFPVDGG